MFWHAFFFTSVMDYWLQYSYQYYILDTCLTYIGAARFSRSRILQHKLLTLVDSAWRCPKRVNALLQTVNYLLLFSSESRYLRRFEVNTSITDHAFECPQLFSNTLLRRTILPFGINCIYAFWKALFKDKMSVDDATYWYTW